MAKFTETHRQVLFASIGVLTLAGVVAIFTLGSGESGRALPGFVPFFGEKEGTSANSAQGNGPNALNTSDIDGTSNSGQPGTKDPSGSKGSNGTEGNSKTDTSEGAKPSTRNGSPNNSSNPTGGTSPVQSTWWKPTPGMSWQWQLTDLPVDLSVEADIYDIDLFDVDASVVTALHDKGRKVICYMSAGSYEDWRSDAGSFPESVLGKDNGWAGERWLDIRAINVLMPIMEARMDLCKKKGFDGVEVDNIDGYTNGTGFPLTPDHQLTYNKRLAKAAHDRGLAIGLKNDLDQIPALVNDFDFAINEECAAYDECAALKPFISANKAVLHAEYGIDTAKFCPTSAALKLSSIRKNLQLDAWRQTCP